MTPGDLALNLEAGGDERKNQPQRNERTQRIVRVNILSLWLWVLVVKHVFIHKEETEVDGGFRATMLTDYTDQYCQYCTY